MMNVKMKTDHIDEIFRLIKDAKLEFIYNTHPLFSKFHTSTSKLRDCLVELEKAKYPNGKLPEISTINPLSLSPKYQLDFLGIEIPQICNQYCVSLASAIYYLPITSDTTEGYFYTKSDLFFWNHIDHGFRLASSGWDRIAFLLNLGFNMQIRKYNLPSVLNALPKIVDGITADYNFKKLKRFRDGQFRDLEMDLSGGARHETTHILSRGTRFFLEFLEHFEPGSNKSEIRREDELNIIKEHYEHLFEGINCAYELIDAHFDNKYFYTT
jgi:hypothetical protein